MATTREVKTCKHAFQSTEPFPLHAVWETPHPLKHDNQQQLQDTPSKEQELNTQQLLGEQLLYPILHLHGNTFPILHETIRV